MNFGLMPQQAKFFSFAIRSDMRSRKAPESKRKAPCPLEVRSSEIGFGRAESAEAFALADFLQEETDARKIPADLFFQ